MQIPTGWHPAGDHPECYEMGVDPAVVYQGQPTVTLKARPSPEGFGTLMQRCKAETYRGQRLRFSAALRTEQSDWAAIWMRVDDTRNQMIAFDNMENRHLSGSGDWAEVSVVLDVGQTAFFLNFGVLQAGPGQVWMAGVRLEPVGLDVPVSDMLLESQPEEILLDGPVNLGFDG